MLVPQLYKSQWPQWRQQDTIHLLINHRSYLDPHFKEYPAFDNINIANYSYTFGDMAREMLTWEQRPFFGSFPERFPRSSSMLCS